MEFNSNHPYNRNNGTMIPNKGYQHIISPGIFFKLGPLSIQLKPEHHYSDNKVFDGFWEGFGGVGLDFGRVLVDFGTYFLWMLVGFGRF